MRLFSYLCENEDYEEYMKDCLPIARKYINYENEDIRVEACWCFANMTVYSNSANVYIIYWFFNCSM